MAERPWVTPEELKEYTEFEEVKNRADSKLKIDISRAESWVIDYCNNRFDDPEKYPEIPENVKTAVLLIAEAYAHNAVEQTKVRLKSETFDDYSYTAESSIIDVGKLGVESLLDDYVVVFVDGQEAVKQFIKKALLTPRFKCLIYDNQYGSEIKDTVTDENATEELIRAEIPRLVEDALLCDGRILKVYDFEFEFNEDSCNVHFTADTIYGTTEVEEVI